ncbi:TonB-dependent receptor [Pelobium sp.]|nr:TonB-dependent receptor [Pelobium sp.]MDA9555419.1 TonB-dependent receptor [Pelobium sp.]
MEKNYLKKLGFLLIFALVSISTYAQTGSISGKVVDETNQPLPGAAVFVEGTKLSTQTDLNGNFRLTGVNYGNVSVTARFIGYNNLSKSIKVSAQNTTVDFKLSPSSSTLNEVVVVGFGTTQKRDLKGSIATVGAKAYENVTVPTVNAGLQGRASGLQVSQSNGVPGSATRIRIRGTSSISASGDPLYVIDGVPVFNSDISDGDFGRNPTKAGKIDPLSYLNPNDIESIDVIKDAAAAAIYGSRGANGIIQITTKKGKAGKTSVSFNSTYGMSEVTRKLPMLTGPEWLQLYNEARVNDGGLPLGPNESINVTGFSFVPGQNPGVNTDWIDQAIQKGAVTENSLSLRGGNDRTRFFISGLYRNEESILKGGAYERAGARVNIDNKASDRLDVGLQFGIYRSKNKQVPQSFNGGIGAAQSFSLPIYPVYNADGSYFGTQFQNTGFNIVAQRESTYDSKDFRTNANVYLAYKIFKNLSFRTENGIDLLNQKEQRYESFINRYFNGKGLATGSERLYEVINFNTNNYFTFDKTFGTNHVLNATAGLYFNNARENQLAVSASSGGVGFVNPYYKEGTSNLAYAPGATVNGSPTTAFGRSDILTGILSYFARANYKYKDRYLFGLSASYDGSAKFGANNKFGFFPAASAAWILSEEDFLKNNKVLNYLKVRASYGITGNNAQESFQYIQTYSSNGGYAGIPGQAPNNLENPDLKWETNRGADLGVDFGFFNNRLSGTLGVYRKVSSDIIVNVPIRSSATGFTSRLLVNSDGVKVRNQGIEFELTSRNFIGNFKWTTNFNIAHNQNKVTDVGIYTSGDAFDTGEGDTRILKGYPLGINFLPIYAGVNPANGDELIFDKNTGAPIKLTAASQDVNRVPVGKPNPDFFGGLENNFSYKGFDLSILFSFQYGNKIYDDGAKYQMGGRLGSWNQRREILNRWQKPGDITDVPRVSLLEGGRADQSNTSRYLFDASFLRLRTVNFGYNLPANVIKALKISSAKIFVSGQNLFVLTKYAGWDPEVVRYNFNAAQANSGFVAPYLPTPQARTFSLGVNVGF